MNKPVTKELRNAPRYQLENPIRLSGCTLPLIAAPAAASRAVEGHVQNISSSGLCLLAQKSLKVSELLVGEIVVPGTQASIPTLLQVRWLQKNSFGPRYRAGLHYVLQGGLTDALHTSTKATGSAAPGNGSARKSPKPK
jgi:hypothetical protein